MKKFILNLFLFCIPIALIYSVPLILFFVSREYLPISEIVQRQQAQPDNATGANQILYNPGVVSRDREYKLEATIEKNPEIIIIGTSRTLTVESKFFKNPPVFYNAGYTAEQSFRTADLVSFINAVPQNSKLKVILFDGSSFLTEPAVGPTQKVTLNQIFETLFTTAWRNIYIDYFEKKFSLLNLIKTEGVDKNIGITARLQDNGFRKDGSFDRNTKQTPIELQTEVQHDLASELTFIVPGHGGFADYSATVPQQDVDEINQFLEICKARNIYVIGYLSPIATELADKMKSMGDQYTDSYNKTPVVLNTSLHKFGYPFYDIRDLSLVNSSDEELYDSHHPTEKGTIKMLLYLANKEPVLRDYIDSASLAKQIEKEKY